MAANTECEAMYTEVAKYGITASQLGDDRPMAACRCSPNGSVVATGSLSSYVKLWNAQSLEPMGMLSGPHAQKERTTGLAWSPRAYVDAADAPRAPGQRQRRHDRRPLGLPFEPPDTRRRGRPG